KAWCETLRRFGTMSLADVMQPAIKHASRGYAATPYLHECITDSAKEMLQDKPISAIYLHKGLPLQPGARVVQAEQAETLTYIAEVLKIAFADRAAASGDPDFINVPVERLTSKDYANERRRAIDSTRAQKWGAGIAQLEGAHTTHMTAADAFGNVVATTQTIN